MEQEYAVSVVDRQDLADGVISLTFETTDGEQLPEWTAGSHIDVILGDELVRQYSLVPSRPGQWAVSVLRDPNSRGGSERIHAELSIGTALTVRGPRNHFALEPAQDYLFIGGGIGITPLLAMIQSAELAGAKWSLAYGGRNRESMAYADALRAAYGDHVTLVPQDELGLIDLPGLLAAAKPGTLVYCCGPTPLLDAVEGLCASSSISDKLHLERFQAAPLEEPVWADSFEIELADSGLILTVPPEKSILQVVDQAGVDVLSSCGEGTCGTCETEILEGEADHRDSVLTDSEKAANTCMMICVSRSACSRLVLEL